MSDFSKEHIGLLRQYFLSDERNKQKIRASASAFTLKTISIVQDGFERKLDAKTIASQIQATTFEKEIEQIKFEYYYKFGEKENLEFEQDLVSAIKQIERESIKKKLIAYDASLVNEISEAEIAAAITAVERESLKNKLRQIDQEEEVPIKAAFMPPAASESGKIKGRAKAAASKIRIPIYMKYAAAACVLLAIGIWQFNVRIYSPPHTDGIVSVNNKVDSLLNDSSAEIFAKKVILAEVTKDTSKCIVLTSGLGFGEVKQNFIIIEYNQKSRIESLEKALQEKNDDFNEALLEGKMSSDTAKIRHLLNEATSPLKKELVYLHLMEQRYLFDGEQLLLYTSAPLKGKAIILYNDNYYLKMNKTFFQLKVSSKPQPLSIEKNTDIIKALDKIMYNAK